MTNPGNTEGPPFTVVDDAVVTLRSLNLTSGDDTFLDGRTATGMFMGSIGLAPTTDPPFTGTSWLMHQEGAANLFSLACLGPARVAGQENDNLWLSATSAGVGLTAVADDSRLWIVADDDNIDVDNAKLLISTNTDSYLRGLPLGPEVGLVAGPDQTFHATSWQLGPIVVGTGQPPPPHVEM